VPRAAWGASLERRGIALRFFFKRVGRIAELNGARSGRNRCILALLQRMYEFMGEQLSSDRRVRSVTAGAKYDALPRGVSPSGNLFGGFFSSGTGMDSDPTEVMAESRFHQCASLRSQRLARRGQDFMHDWWNGAGTRRRNGQTL
jgi:hypothetical protein